jgi:hypothetical protein
MTETALQSPDPDPDPPAQPTILKSRGPKGFVEHILLGGIMGCILIFTLPMIFIGALVNAYVLTCLWDWFIVTTFTLPSLTLAQAYGISLLMSFLRKDAFQEKLDVVCETKKDENDEHVQVYHLKSYLDTVKHGWAIKAGFGLILLPACVLGVGKLVHAWFIV